jgi:hypothetical protein
MGYHAARAVTQEKDHKGERQAGSGRIAQKTLVGVAAIPSNGPPRPERTSNGPPRPERTSNGPPRPERTSKPSPALSPSLSRNVPSVRDFFAAPAPAREAPKSAQGHRQKQASLEEISSSLLLEDDSSSAVMPGLEELSGSLLLEEPPTEVRADLAAPEPPQPRAEPQLAAHRALLGMPELPSSTPAPNLQALAPMPSPLMGAPRPEGPHAGPAEPSESAPAEGSAPEGLELDDPTRIVPPPPQHMYEALKGYEAEAPAAAPAAPSPAPVEPAQPVHSTAPVQGDVEVTSLPPSPWVAATETARRVLQQWRSSLGGLTRTREPRRWLFLAAIALGGLVVGTLIALIVSLTRKGTDDASQANEANGKKALAEGSSAPAAMAPQAPQAAPGAPIVTTATPAAAPAPVEPVFSTTACVVAGAPRIVAPSAIVGAGIEVRAVGDDMALGFAPNEHQATALRLNAASLASTSKVDAQSADAIRRVVPLASADGSLSIAEDADRDGDAVHGRRTVPLDPPLEIGSAAGNLVWARPNGPAAGTLWPLDGDGTVEALRGSTDPAQNGPITAIAFRHAGAIWLGTASGRETLAPVGPLTRAAGSSSAVGSPAIAVSGGAVLAAWADRVATMDPWRLRWVSFKAGEAPSEPGTFTPPAGGKGEQAMSPGIAAVAGGRFLLVWTEGPATRHDVRALTLSHEGQPLGKPLLISSKNVNAGQGQAAVNAAGRGAVAFLESAEGGFQVVATPVKCAP